MSTSASESVSRTQAIRNWIWNGSSWLQRLAKCLLLLLFCLLLLLTVFGALPSRFILIGPSVSYTKPLAAIVGIVVGVLLAAYFMRFTNPEVSNRDHARLLLVIPIIVGYLSYRALAFGAPALIALVVHEPHTLIVQVADNDAYDGKSCRHAVKLKGFAENIICNIPSAQRSELQAGQPARIKGFGYSMGIYVETFVPITKCNSEVLTYKKYECEQSVLQGGE